MPSSKKPAQIAETINYHLGRLIPVTTPLGIVLGFFLPSVFIHLRPLVPWLFGLMTFSGALKLRASEIGNAVRSPMPIVLFFITAHIIMPVAALLSSSLFFSDTDIVTGFVLLFSGPTAVSGFIWVMVFNGNKALALTLILLDTILAPLVVPGTLSILLGQTISMDMTGIAVSLIMMVVLPTIFGVTANEVSKGKVPYFISPYLEPLAKICLIAVIAANASPVVPKVRFNEPLIWKVGIICILLLILGFVIIYFVTLLVKCEREKSTSVIVAGGLKNNSALMTISVTFFPEAAALPIIMSLVFQQSIVAFVGKFLGTKDEKYLP